MFLLAACSDEPVAQPGGGVIVSAHRDASVGVVGSMLVWGRPVDPSVGPLPDAGPPLTPAQARAQARAEAAAAKKKAKDDALLAKQAAKAECERTQQIRQNVAEALEKTLLEEGQDAYVRARGKCGTTLSIQWVLCSRPFVYKLQNDGDPSSLAKTIRDVGFAHVNCYDGFDTTVSGDF